MFETTNRLLKGGFFYLRKIMKQIHFVLQGKGGVGKSFVASLLAQYLKTNNDQVHCYDTDPVNQTFSRYKTLDVEVVNILTEHKSIDVSRFDALIEDLLEKDGVAVIDNGAATFVPLMSYIRESGVIELLKESGVDVVVHVPLQAGQGIKDTVQGLLEVLGTLQTNVVVWLNHYWGRIELNNSPVFEQSNVYKENSNQITAVIELENYNPDTFGKDIQEMTTAHLTFDEVQQSAQFKLMPKQRLKKVQRDVFNQLAQKTFFERIMENPNGVKS